jgi:hypothetical protein
MLLWLLLHVFRGLKSPRMAISVHFPSRFRAMLDFSIFFFEVDLFFARTKYKILVSNLRPK